MSGISLVVREKWCVSSKLWDCCDVTFQPRSLIVEMNKREGKIQNWKCSHIQCMCRTIVMERSRCRGGGADQKLQVASEMGHGIILIMVRLSQGIISNMVRISFVTLSVNPALVSGQDLMTCNTVLRFSSLLLHIIDPFLTAGASKAVRQKLGNVTNCL